MWWMGSWVERMSNSGKPELEGASRAVVPSNLEGSGSVPTPTSGCSQWSQKH